MKRIFRLTERQFKEVMDTMMNETDWYNIEKWDKANQKYVNHLGGHIDVLRQQPMYKAGDVVNVKAFQNEYIGQIIGVFVNYDTQEYLYGIRLFTALEYENGSTMLVKAEPDDIVGKVSDIPRNVLNNPRYNK